MAPPRDKRALYPVVWDAFWKMAEELPLGASRPFENTDLENNQRYQTLFYDHPEGMGVLVSLCSLMDEDIEGRGFMVGTTI